MHRLHLPQFLARLVYSIMIKIRGSPGQRIRPGPALLFSGPACSCSFLVPSPARERFPVIPRPGRNKGGSVKTLSLLNLPVSRLCR